MAALAVVTVRAESLGDVIYGGPAMEMSTENSLSIWNYNRSGSEQKLMSLKRYSYTVSNTSPKLIRQALSVDIRTLPIYVTNPLVSSSLLLSEQGC